MTLIWGGLALGAVYALVAVCYNIVFISSKTFNFAQAQLIMVGAFVAYTGLVTWKLSVPLVMLLAVASVMALAAIEERLAVRPVKDPHNILVTTLGVSILLNGATQLVWGTQPLNVPFFGGNDVLELFGGQIYPVEIALVLVAVVLVWALTRLSRRFLVGLALLGMSEDREAAMLRGVNVRRLAFGAFAFSGAVAGLLGMFVGPKTFAVATLGASLALKGFVVLAIGGFGSMPGTLVGGLVVGLAEALAARYLGGEYANITVFVILITILLVRPAGLFVRVRERTV
ncbi:branched-chain amino acid ABC transporter permease [Streptomyces antnestii]|uniref:Branched-chain amino acid ABC transporter permease n=1 Tax=Streptomyces antnestii TaxID=2494256 RepID=A0A3S2VKP9_9ACTN|nr:branched-chain amino acid ABC transporter permease [Streptomyces sp. San01]RVU28084.1 branched-chain amino acid ABC transporter permease [Streptomyces sp. San01]